MKRNFDFLTEVKEFHERFEHPILPTPQIPSVDRCALRVELLREELEELQHAIHTKNIVEVADAFCDLQYVLSGAILEFGMGEKFPSMFDMVHHSNMSKACSTIKEAEDTIKFYLEKDGTESYYKEKDGIFLVYRKSDNKTLKSVNYTPVNLKPILYETVS